MALGYLLAAVRRTSRNSSFSNARLPIAVILASAFYMALSVAWSSVDLADAWISWTRHARLLTIPILVYLLQDEAEGHAVLRAFAYAQLFVVISSSMLVLGLPVPWALAVNEFNPYTVFGSYLEQSISQAVLVGILWFQRDTIFGPRGRRAAIIAAAATLVLTLGFMQGRSGHLVAVGVVTLACLYALPKNYKWAIVVVPFLVVALMLAGSSNFRNRLLEVNSEVSAYAQSAVKVTSSGDRLEYWRASVLAFTEKPVLGYGAGSWNHEYRRIEGIKPTINTANPDNPHQLFLLWAVEGGIVGLALLCAVFGVVFLHSRQLKRSDALTQQSILLSLVISGMFNSMIYGIGMGDFFCIAIGLLMSMGNALPATHEASHSGR
jgi:O-antigen ligase